MTGPIRVLVADDHAIVRKGLCLLLCAESDIEVVGEAENLGCTATEACRLQPDVILMHLMMLDAFSIEAIQAVRTALPGARILVLTNCAADMNLSAVTRAGAKGYLIRESSPEALLQTIRRVHESARVVHPTGGRRTRNAPTDPPEEMQLTPPLTTREMSVLRLVARGYSNREIAERLVISEATVRTHVSNILGTLHLSSRTQAALYALRNRLVSLDQSD